MPDFKWPEEKTLIGGRIKRLDGPIKSTGRAKYSYDVNRPEMLYGRILHCPHAHARIVRIDTARAERLPGVRAVHVIQQPGTEIQWALDEIAYVAADTDELARDAVSAIEVEYELLPHFVNEERRDAAPEVNPGDEEVTGDPAAAFASAAHESTGGYGARCIAHCCLEAHGQVCEWDAEGKLTAWASTQNVSGLSNQFGEGLGVPAADVRVITPVMGGGFGSKFGVDRWGIECAKLARATGRPVKLMLERDAELTIAGDRPSAFAEIRVAADGDGTVTAWHSESWGSGGLGGAGSPPLPYVFTEIPNKRHRHSSIPTNIASSRAWRAPNHPQGCLLTMAALDDLAATMSLNPLDFFDRNLQYTARPDVYRQELAKADELMGFRQRWRPRDSGDDGPVRQGLGLALHTWGGRAHNSTCEIVIHPDGSVEVKMGTQDLGTGTRTVLAIVAAETFGLPLEAIQVRMGDSQFPRSGASGGSTTVGGVSSSTRRGCQTALEQLFEKVAPRLETTVAELEAKDGRIQVRGDASRSLGWREATALLGVNSLTASGANPGPGSLNSSGVGGVQMADVSVDIETGVVRINKMVAVQDCGLIIDMMTAESQVYGALIMGIAYALSEEKIMDPISGLMLNADMEFYKLPGIGDIGELVVHMMTGPGYDDRGVIGLGEPPVISPGAAISNAVANAIGVRVPEIPLTPDRVLAALEGGRG